MSETDRAGIDRLEEPAFRLAAKARASEHEARVKSGEASASYRVGLAATFTLEPLVPFLTDGLLAAGLPPEVRLAPYGQVFQACLEPRSAFRELQELDAIVLLWRLEDVARDDLEAFLAGDTGALAVAEGKIASLAAAVGTLRGAFAGTILLATPPFPDPPGFDLLDPRNPRGAATLHARLRLAWLAALEGTEPLLLFDLDALQRHYGASRARDPRTAYLYRQPYREGFLALLGERLASVLASTRVAPRKCVAVDCDNALWGGVVGEDGPEGVEVGDDFPGSAYRDFQKLLVSWRRDGVLLALLSRNNEADVWEVFEKRREMPLRREDIAAWRIDWRPKAENLPLLAEALGIGVDSFVFLDDSPAEIAEMREAWPEVRSLLLPEDPARIVDEVSKHRLFDRLETTAEDRRRTEMMATESRRSGLKARLSHEEFLASLGLAVRVSLATEDVLPRVAQLVAKTNQFNLTTIRRSPDELRRLMTSGDHRVFVLSAADRFGDYGLTGVAIVRQEDPGPEIDTFLLSCRVLGRGVETAFLAAIAEDARRRGASRIRARFVPTAKNAPAKDFLPGHGFREAEGGLWSAGIDDVPPRPPHVTAAPAVEPEAPPA